MRSPQAVYLKLMSWLDKNILLCISILLLILIPLYPKIPFFSPIEQYIVRVRLEDFFVLFSQIVLLILVLKKKASYQTPLTKFISIYLLVGFLSIVTAIFIIKTVPIIPIHLEKTILHFLRYLEYFSLFFLFFASIKKKKDGKVLIITLVITTLAITIYGVGQKYFYWPVYSTMNREFSKGIRLYLTDHARVQSTFAGHYDLAAYLVIVLPIILALALWNKKYNRPLLFTYTAGFWLLVVSAARTSFAAFSLACLLVIFFLALKRKTSLQKIQWFLKKSLLIWLINIIIVLNFGGDIYERFLQVLQSYPLLNNQYHQLNEQRKKNVSDLSLNFNWQLHTAPPANSLSTAEAAIIVASDQRPTAIKPNTTRPIDVYQDIPDKVIQTITTTNGFQEVIIIEQPRVWSNNALKYGLSMAIRLDSLWPNAINGFMKNPVSGSGYATLNKQNLTDFTIADSTDNNFLRTLGETGLLGFITFYGTVLTAIILSIQKFNHQNKILAAISIGFVAGSIGLLLNAVYIDVFAASKVAFSYWSITGLVLGYQQLFIKHSLLKNTQKK